MLSLWAKQGACWCSVSGTEGYFLSGVIGCVQALDVLSKAPGVSIINDRAANRFPTPLDASNQVICSMPSV